MKWVEGYFILCAICSLVIAKDLIPLLTHIKYVMPSFRVWQVLLGHISSLAVLGAFLPGKEYPGVPLSDGTLLKYKCNGVVVMGAFVTALAIAHWNGNIDGAWVADNYAELFVAANIFAFTFSFFLFIKGRLARPPNWLRHRSALQDFVLGAELNPFFLGLNLKFFSYRPSMAGWLAVNLSFLCKQYATLGFITSRMLLYQLATAWYIWDYFVHEPKMLSTWDIIAENFGLMLVWGDYVFIVFGFRYSSILLFWTSSSYSCITDGHSDILSSILVCVCLSTTVFKTFFSFTTLAQSHTSRLLRLQSCSASVLPFFAVPTLRSISSRRIQTLPFGESHPSLLEGNYLPLGFGGLHVT